MTRIIEDETLGFIPTLICVGQSQWIPDRGDRVLPPGAEAKYIINLDRPFKLTELWFHNVDDDITLEQLYVGSTCVISGPLPAKHYDIAWILKLKDENGLKDETIKRVLDRLRVSAPVAIPGSLIRLHVKNHSGIAMHRVDVTATGLAGDLQPQNLSAIFGKMGTDMRVRKVQTSSKYGFVGGRFEEPVDEINIEIEDEDEGAWSTPSWEEP